MGFGDTLKALRKQQGKTTTQCAADVGVTQPAWNQWELGLREPKFDKLREICRLFNCSSDWLLGLKDHGRSVSVNAADGAAVAIGTGAMASASAAKKAAPAHDCRKCPYKAWGDKFRKAGGTIPGV